MEDEEEGGKEKKRRRKMMASGTIYTVYTCKQLNLPTLQYHTHWSEQNPRTFPFAAEPALEDAFFPLEGGADFSGFSFSFSLAAAPSLLEGDCFAFGGGC